MDLGGRSHDLSHIKTGPQEVKKMKCKIAITGFGPFFGCRENPSALLVARLRDDDRSGQWTHTVGTLVFWLMWPLF